MADRLNSSRAGGRVEPPPFAPAPGKGRIMTAWGDLREAGRFLSRSGLLPLLGVVAGINLALSALYMVKRR